MLTGNRSSWQLTARVGTTAGDKRSGVLADRSQGAAVVLEGFQVRPAPAPRSNDSALYLTTWAALTRPAGHGRLGGRWLLLGTAGKGRAVAGLPDAATLAKPWNAAALLFDGAEGAASAPTAAAVRLVQSLARRTAAPRLLLLTTSAVAGVRFFM